jgi:hypothetical protein
VIKSINRFISEPKDSVSAIVIIACFVVVAFIERTAGRRWWCACGEYDLWSGDIWGYHNSQHLFDPYSLTHVLHGIALAGLIGLVCSKVSINWRLSIAVIVEGCWEIFENSSFIINRYRTETSSIGYQGDSIFNSLGDVLSCTIGFMIAVKLGWRRSIVLFLLVEAVLLIWIRDSLLLELVMLIHPIHGVKSWQLPH